MEIPCIVCHPNEKNKSCKRPCLKKTNKKNPQMKSGRKYKIDLICGLSVWKKDLLHCIFGCAEGEVRKCQDRYYYKHISIKGLSSTI